MEMGYITKQIPMNVLQFVSWLHWTYWKCTGANRIAVNQNKCSNRQCPRSVHPLLQSLSETVSVHGRDKVAAFIQWPVQQWKKMMPLHRSPWMLSFCRLWCFHILLIQMIFTTEHNFNELWSLNTGTRSKKHMFGCYNLTYFTITPLNSLGHIHLFLVTALFLSDIKTPSL